MFSLGVSLLFFLLSLVIAAIYLTARPRNFPRNVPVVPLWIQVRAKLQHTSRVAFYNKEVRPLAEKHGAVALWQEDRWTVVVSRPPYVAQILKSANQEIEKRGMFARNPHSNGALLFGENIIDSNGELHDEFVDIIKPAIVKKLSIAVIREEAAALAGRLHAAQESAGFDAGISIDELLWRCSINIFGGYFLDSMDWPLSFHETSAQHITMLQSSGWMSNLRGMFMVTHRLPWTAAAYKRAAAAIRKLDDALFEVSESRKAAAPAPGEEKLSHRLARAHDAGNLSTFHYRSNLKQLLVAGHENVEVVLQSAMFELAVDQRLQERLHSEVTELLPADYSLEEIDRLPVLASIVYETLRLYPPLGMLINRETVKPMQLGAEILLPAGTIVGWSAYAVHTDPQVWGETARQFAASRWGADIEAIRRMARSTQARGQFVPFSMHARRCLGSTFALAVLKVALCELARKVEWKETKESRFDFNPASHYSP